LTPYSIFQKLDLDQLQPIPFSLQLADDSVKCPLGILGDVPIKVGDFCVLDDIIVLDIVEDAYA